MTFAVVPAISFPIEAVPGVLPGFLGNLMMLQVRNCALTRQVF